MLSRAIDSSDIRELGERVRETRKRLGMTQAQLAEKADMANNTVSRIEGSQINLSAENLFDLADALGVTPNDLSPSRFRTNRDITTTSVLSEKYSKLTEENRELFISAVQAMVDGLLFRQSKTSTDR